MKFLWFYIICWKYRNSPMYELAEQYTITLKAARRCAYDLSHCAGDLSMEASNNNTTPMFDYGDFARQWQEIFTPTGGKDYRNRLHHKIDSLELEISRLHRLCKANDIDSADPDGVPF